ncbi:FAD-binding oxidoreductase [Aquibacillus koreensis]|uniref:FAD-binding oxidoreductase n=1 Tax=Aquibacillus koreensis TaxID=279446 RepID=A0A9X4AK25_9BACI|nr:FAD-dependent oxidoreductase [Aquibacillus koreensis]MCT2537700.1 FAD-binding oxidoreductase [Aquibacillus koreensis]MDC3420953.1 FAD-binding oxidoreductase [Aquibacillus koreensis]
MQKYIIVGAGILGASTAYHLAKKGVAVTIVDRNDPGQATNAAAGIICPWLTNRRNKAWYRLVKAGAKYYPTLIKALNRDGETQTGYQNVGAINIFDTEEKLDRKMAFAQERKKESPEMGQLTKLSSSETRKLFPVLSDEYGAIHISGASRVNGAELRDALMRAAWKNGAKVVSGDASLLYSGEKVTGITIGGNDIHADQVIVTSGAWAKDLFEPLGISFLVRAQKAQIVHLEMPNVDTSHWPVLLPPYNQYMLAFNHGKVVIGTTHEDDFSDHEVKVGAVHSIMDKALRVAPGLASSVYIETKVGFRPFTPNHLPVIGKVPGVDGLFVANGLGASGLTSGPYLGGELAKIVLGKETELNLDDYNVANALAP